MNLHEFEMAAGVGFRRQLEAVRAHLPDKHGIDPKDGWFVHINGACAELDVAKLLGLYWGGSVNTFRSVPDVGDLEVRCRSRHSYELIVREDDAPNQIYVHVTGIAPALWVRGWIRGTDARRKQWLRTHGDREPAWFVPNEALQPFTRLERIVQ